VGTRLTSAFIIVVTAAAAELTLGSGKLAAQTDAEAEQQVRSLMAKAEIPGLSLATVESGKLAWHEAFGIKHAETGEPVTGHTIFEAASLSKPVFAYAVLRLVDRGEWDLDEPLWTVLEYDRVAHDERAQLITTRMVLSHMTGLPNWGGTPLELVRDPDTQWGYSGEGFGFLARAIEQQTGLEANALVRREVFEPLGMSQSSYVWTEAYDEQAATGHGLIGTPLPKGRPQQAHAAATLHTTAVDYARFLAAMMTGKGLEPATYEAMLTPQSQVFNRDSLVPDVYWGLGWGLQETERGAAIWHWGDNMDFRAYVIGYPAEDAGLVYFTNSENGLAIAEDLVSFFFEDTHYAIHNLDYSRWDDAGRLAQMEMRRAFRDEGLAAGMRVVQAFVEAQPDSVVRPQLGRLGDFLIGQREFEAVIALATAHVERDPSAYAWAYLAEGYTGMGDYERALECYHQALAMDSTQAQRLNPRVAWLQVGIDMQPVALSEDELRAYEGVYGPRNIGINDGGLVYWREGSTRETRMIPLGHDLFALESTKTFRMRIVFDDARRATKIVGLYSDGRTDESPRSN
jgi:CubicO group peptidase (beta-lactamase class C family)